MPELPFEIPRTYAEEAVLHLFKASLYGAFWHTDEIARELNMNERIVRKCVANLVELGEPILSGPKGYWIARSAEDVERAYESLRRRALSILRRMSRLKPNAKYDEMVGQMRLALEEKANE